MPESINLGNPEEVTILDIANEILELTNSNSEITFKDLPLDDPVRKNQIFLEQLKFCLSLVKKNRIS